MFALFPLFGFIAAVSAAISSANSSIIERAYIVRLSEGSSSASIRRDSADHLAHFHKRASSLDYSVRHEFKNQDVFLGLSIQVNGNLTESEIRGQLQEIEGVVSVSQVMKVSIPIQPGGSNLSDPLLSYSNNTAKKTSYSNGSLGKALEMGGVDKLHGLGIKGYGVKIGVVDTGVDYRHPALGGGFGPGKKIAGGYAFVYDNGTLGGFSDPLTTCYGGGHGTHVSGIIGMDENTFNIVGVAPQASIYMYRVFDCSGNGGSDTIVAAMTKAYEDGVDIVSMSLSVGQASFNGQVDPLAAITKTLTDDGIAVIVAQSNDAHGSLTGTNLYDEEWPSTEPTAIAVGAISNVEFPVVYTAQDSLGSSIKYASVYPIDLPGGARVYILGDGCNSQDWIDAISTTGNVNNTIFAFYVTGACLGTSAGSWTGAPEKPVYIMAINTDGTSPYTSDYDTPSQGFYGTTQFININAADGTVLAKNFNLTGGYPSYKLNFGDTSFIGVPQISGGLIDYYSSFGPTWHDYIMKPQIAAPGGHVLSTWPLGPLGGYAILSGTSMATPYLAGCFALLKSQLPGASNNEILSRLQTTAHPVVWALDRDILSATAQQGAGIVDVHNALISRSLIFPSQLKISDVSKTEYGTANFTIQNKSPEPKTYTFSHSGAGYMDYYVPWGENSQVANYGSANFSTPTVTVPAGESATVVVSVTPPQSVVPSNLPVFGGFLNVASNDESFSVPYLGPPYSLYNTPYLLITSAASGVQLPEVYAFNADQSQVTYDTGLLDFVASYGYGGGIPTIQWTQHIRLDVLPANTSITADHYGFDRNVTWNYIPSLTIPSEKIFGYESFGVLFNETGYLWPNGNNPFGSSDIVMGSNNQQYEIGNGDYRWFASVLRWGGTMGVEEDYDTWLGPIIRFVDAPSGNSTTSG